MSQSTRWPRLSLALPLTIATLALAPLERAGAQDGFDATAAARVRDHYLADLDTVHSKILQLANAIPADKYSWRPAQGVRSISEVFMHVASEWYVYVPMSVAGKPPEDYGNPREKNRSLEKDVTSKSDVIDHLTKAWGHAKNQVATADPAQLTGTYKPFGMTLDGAAFEMAGDLHEHLGQLIAYARSVGVKPPWSK
jgi:hypothetical protein